jgi:hypothetical protein
MSANAHSSATERRSTPRTRSPREPLPPGAVPCSVSADMLPAKSSLLIELDLGTGGDW